MLFFKCSSLNYKYLSCEFYFLTKTLKKHYIDSILLFETFKNYKLFIFIAITFINSSIPFSSLFDKFNIFILEFYFSNKLSIFCISEGLWFILTPSINEKYFAINLDFITFSAAFFVCEDVKLP